MVHKDEVREDRILMDVAEINWNTRTLCVPLAQLQPLDVNEQTQEAVEDWHYWMARGYEF